MGQNSIKYILGQGGLNGQKPSEDHVSMLLWEHTVPPTAWASDTIRSFRSLEQLAQSGVTKYDPLFAEVYYQVSEFFRIDPDSEVYVGFKVMSTGTVAEQVTAILAATGDGRVRQIGGFINDIVDTAVFQSLANELLGEDSPVVCVVGCDFSVEFNAIPDLHIKIDDKVNVLCSGDGGAEGILLAQSLGVTYKASIGAEIGVLSLAPVNESIAYVRKYNISNGVELEQPIFSNGTLLKDTLTAYLDEFHDKGFTYVRKHRGIAGSYFNDSYTASALADNDYATLENNRTVQKAIRLSRASLLEELSAPVLVDPNTGTLSVNYIEHLKSLSDNGIFPMEQAAELSGFATLIDANQDVLSTSEIEVVLELVPVGVSRNIIVKVNYVLRLSNQS